MASQSKYLIVGGGVAAARAVEGIRDVDSGGDIVVVTAEDHPPYERPPLSKAVLQGKDAPEVVYSHPAQWYAEHGVELRQGDAAAQLDAAQRRLRLASGAELGFERLLLATGSKLRRLNLPGADLAGVHYLRTLDDSLVLRQRFAEHDDVVIIGTGWIGLEVAAAARAHQCRVTIIEPQSAPLARVLGEQVGGWFARLHTDHGVDLRLGIGVQSFVGVDRVTGVVTDAGVTIPADVVVVGVGIQPEVDLAEAAGLDVDNGILTDSALRTSADGIWAAGDVANWPSPVLGRRIRVEHWANAYDGGFAAGRSMAGAEVSYDPVPFFFSDQYDAGLEYAGWVPPEALNEVVIRGDLDGSAFMAFWVERVSDRVRVLAGMHVNVWDTMDAVQGLIRHRRWLDPDRLADPGVPLADLAG